MVAKLLCVAAIFVIWAVPTAAGTKPAQTRKPRPAMLHEKKKAASDLEKADAKMHEVLDDIYAKIRASAMSDSGRVEEERVMKDSQEKWKAYRDSYASVYGRLFAGEDLRQMAVITCRRTLTKDRLKVLKVLLEDLGE